MSTEFINDQWRLPNAWNGSESNVNKQSNYSMDFDGSSQYVDASNLSVTGDWSVSLWVNSNSTSYQTAVQLANSTTTGTNDSLIFLYLHPGGASANWGFYDGSSTLIGSALNTGQWYNLIVTKSGTTYTLFLNGTQENQNTKANINIEDLLIGKRSANIFYMDGKIDGVSIYNYALSSIQVTTLYGSSSTGIGNPMSLSPKPVAMYNLGDQDAFNGADYLVPNSSLKDYVFSFNGSNDYISLNTTQTFNTEFTISLWLNPNDVTEVNLLGNSSDISNFLYINASSELQINSPNFSAQAFTNTTFSIGSWQHVILTRDSNNIFKAYKNGNLLDTSSAVSGAFSFNEIGRYGAVSTYIFNGKMSNVQIFNTALPATGSNSVETIYNNGSPLTSMSGYSSLVGWWKLDASATYDSSTTTWTIPDDSTNSNDGTSSGMTQSALQQSDLSFTSGYSPYALDFDSASSDYIDCGDSDNFSFGDGTNDSPFSVSAWVYFNSASTSAGIIGKYAATNATKEWLIYMYPQKFRLLLQDGAYYNFATATSTTIQTNQWYNIITTYDGRGGANANQGINIYVNGQLQTLSYTGSSSYVAMNNTNAVVRIGRYGTGNYFDGSISNCSIWNTELTQAQVTEIYSEGIPQNLNNHSAYSNLVSWWQLGSNSSFNTNWTVLDEKGSNNGTSVNMTEDDIVDGVGSYANGLSSGMGGDEVIGDAPYSTANSLSVNMDVLDRVEDTPS